MRRKRLNRVERVCGLVLAILKLSETLNKMSQEKCPICGQSVDNLQEHCKQIVDDAHVHAVLSVHNS